MALEMKSVGIGLLIILLMLLASQLAIQNIGTNASATFEALERELIAEQVPAVSKPGPSTAIRTAMDELATSVAAIAIQVSLIPRDLLDRQTMGPHIRGQLQNQLGDDWTIEVICFAGWCNIKLKHELGECIIDANNGAATKSVHFN